MLFHLFSLYFMNTTGFSAMPFPSALADKRVISMHIMHNSNERIRYLRPQTRFTIKWSRHCFYLADISHIAISTQYNTRLLLH